jgi:NitT/TauT family transport system ATP-binding protein/taurine transport system ATP-binding protein
MQQRCQLARVMATDPQVVLMDEPFGALDALTRDRLQEELARIWRGSGRTVLFVTHSVEEAVALGTRVVVLSPRPGRIVLDVDAPFAAAGVPVSASRDLPEFGALRREISNAITQEDR